MAQPAKAQLNSSRAKAQARRRAMSSAGKTAVRRSVSAESTVQAGMPQPVTAQPVTAANTATAGSSAVASRRATANSSRAASLQRRKALSIQGKTAMANADRTRTAGMQADIADKDCGCGCNGSKTSCSTDTAGESNLPICQSVSSKRLKRKPRVNIKSDSCRAAALARRKAHSTRGKAGISKSGMSSAQTARASNPGLSSRDLARELREQKNRRGSAGQKKSVPTGRMRPARKTDNGSAQDAPWKVGASNTSHGQTVTGTMVGRSQSVTGDEASTCRDVTGTEYLGADIFKNFCQSEPAKSVRRGGTTTTALGNGVTGNRVGRSQKVTGDEPGTCKNVTGADYVDANQSATFCGTSAVTAKPLTSRGGLTDKGKKVTGDNVGRSGKVTGDEPGSGRTLTGTQYMQPSEGKAPSKVGESMTLSGGSVTGSRVGRSERVTGDEPGSCRNVTGDDYIGQEQFKSFCGKTPERTERKSGVSRTINGESVTGTMTGRGGRVTGNEPGTCKAVTGTPYAGAEQYDGYCEVSQSKQAAARMQKNKAFAGAVMTGIQPAIGGKMTGDDKGACETVSGTAYVGRDQLAQACPSLPAEPGSPDFPQPLGESFGSGFSVSSPVDQAQELRNSMNSITGSNYEQGSITGPFGMAKGKVTGTEQARFGHSDEQQLAARVEETVMEVNARQTSRITGEGMDAGPKITGDDWERGERVTGTEGASAKKRNLTMRGGTSAMASVQTTRNDEIPDPVSRVTGGSGNTEKGALITYSGGARG